MMLEETALTRRANKRRERAINKTRAYAKFIIWLGTFGALLAFATWYVGWVQPIHVILLISLFALTELGITIGFHRLFTHRAFVANKSIVFLFGILGCMAAQGPILYWATSHRQHHQHSDDKLDPHSPVQGGFWHAHMGWMLGHEMELRRTLVRDLRHDPQVQWIDRHYIKWLVLGFVTPAVIAGLWTGTLQGVVTGFIWGGLFRMFLVHHCTWMVNSICHIFGRRAYATSDNSRNNAIVAVLTMGEGWHNNHHAYPRSARHGLRWWQWDPSYYCIWLLEKLKLIKGVRLPGSI